MSDVDYCFKGEEDMDTYGGTICSRWTELDLKIWLVL